MACQFKDKCPSYTGWCLGPKHDFAKCVHFLITAYNDEKAKREELELRLKDGSRTELPSESN